MASLIRAATPDDLDAVAQIAKETRELRARLHDDYWPVAKGADELHRKFLAYMLGNPDLKKHVLEKDGRVIGFEVVQPRPAFSFIDDICLAGDADWKTDGVKLLLAIEERPAITTVAHGDTSQVEAALDAGLTLIGTHRLIQLASCEHRDAVVSADAPADLVDPPLHVFIPMMDAEPMVFIEGDAGGYAVCSQSIMPPPILDTSGTAAIIDRVVGDDRKGTFEKALSFLKDRGDIGAIVIIDAEDHDLAQIADSMGATRPVDILKWPE